MAKKEGIQSHICWTQRERANKLQIFIFIVCFFSSFVQKNNGSRCIKCLKKSSCIFVRCTRASVDHRKRFKWRIESIVEKAAVGFMLEIFSQQFKVIVFDILWSFMAYNFYTFRFEYLHKLISNLNLWIFNFRCKFFSYYYYIAHVSRIPVLVFYFYLNGIGVQQRNRKQWIECGDWYANVFVAMRAQCNPLCERYVEL